MFRFLWVRLNDRDYSNVVITMRKQLDLLGHPHCTCEVPIATLALQNLK